MVTTDMLSGILQCFGLPAQIKKATQLQYKKIQEGERALRDIIGVEVQSGERYVVKLVDEPSHPRELIERQIAFSEALRQSGALVARYYACEDGWTIEKAVENFHAIISCEDFIGTPIKKMNLQTIQTIGALIGCQHRLSLEKTCRVGKQKTYLEVMSHSRYSKIWRGGLPKSVDESVYRSIERLHDTLMPTVEDIWLKLPMAAVHADVYALNNIAMTAQGIAAYDFNLAADEVLLGDLLISWFRTVINPDMWNDIDDGNHHAYWQAMLKGYEQERRLTDPEKEHLPMLYTLMDAIYSSTLAFQFEEIEEYDNARICMRHALSVLEEYR